jgi:2-polyprenyl-6-methoxyphenol hydroxylase-like FAD-dependent oxidoreductase
MNNTILDQDNDHIHDVIQVGYGPVSEISAVMLARQGHSVAVFERWTERYPLPRAVCIDHEIYRVLAAIGLGDQLPGVTHPAPPYRWFNAQWKELLHIDWSAESISGGPEVHFVHQPTLETMFDHAARRHRNIEVNLGWEVQHVRQTPHFAEVVARHVDSGELRIARARYVIGADGANSLVRTAIGAQREDRGFEADWLVIDVLPNDGEQLDIPAAAQYCNPARPTTIVPAGVSQGRYYRRWEFMRMPGESREELETEAAAWRLLEPWVKPHQATMVRHKLYTFRSLIADKWRSGRLLIAGDAAHVMPPFMGQGMCAGLRDAWNLSWKLHLVLTGQARDSLLDTYEAERRPHASDIVDLSMYLGKVICIPDPEVAAQRDRAFFDGSMEPPPAFPSLTAGLIDVDGDGRAAPVAGLLSPHGTVRRQSRLGRYDDLVAPGFALVVRDALAFQHVSAETLGTMGALGGTVSCLAEEGGGDSSATCIVDVDGKFGTFMDAHGVCAMLVRPDFYLFGGAAHAVQIDALVARLGDAMAAYGVRALQQVGQAA